MQVADILKSRMIDNRQLLRYRGHFIKYRRVPTIITMDYSVRNYDAVNDRVEEIRDRHTHTATQINIYK